MRIITRSGLLLTLLLLSVPVPGQDGNPWNQGVVLEETPSVLPERDRIDVVNRILEDRLENLLPRLMRETGIDLWLVLNREYNEDPVYLTLVPAPAFAARRTTMLVFHDGGPEKGVERLRDLFGSAHFRELEERLWNAALHGFGQSFGDLWQGLIKGAKNMMGIGVATAAAGIIVGTVTLTGLGSRFIEAIEIISLGNVVLMLVLAAVTSLILGMGLPTTANYIVMATLTAPVIVALGAKSGLVVPLLAAHLFVFYFGILADDTPPVGLAAFAASAIAKSDPVRTGIQGFIYDLRTAILPFVFIFNLELLMIGGVKANGEIIWINDVFRIGWICFASLVAIFAFASALQGFFVDECNWGERGVLFAVCVAAFRPSLVTEFTGGARMLVQLAAVAIFVGLYLYQKKRRLTAETVSGIA